MAVKTVHLHTDLPCSADTVYDAMLRPTTFLYLCRGLLGIPALAGRTAQARVGESGSGRLLLLHFIPLHRHSIEIVDVDPGTRTLRTHERGGVVRSWRHALHVEPLTDTTCRYSDTVDVDAGRLTPLAARLAVLLYRYRHRRWHTLVREHLSPA